MPKPYTLVFKIHWIIILLLSFPFVSSAQYDSIFSGGNFRTYLLHLPDGYTPGSNYPLVLALHGGLGSAEGVETMSELSIKADAEEFIVVYPEGIPNGILKTRTWNAGWCCGYASSSNTDDVGFINTLMDTLIGRYTIDIKRIYVTGMSNGGFMTYRLACELSDRIAAIAPVACSMTMTSCTPGREMPIIHFHSYLDENIPFEGGVGNGFSDHYNPPVDSVLNAWAGMNGCAVLNDTLVHNVQYTHLQWTSCLCETKIDLYITEDGGHSWPGGNQTTTGDPVSAYINATDLMWSFFQQYTLDCPITVMHETLSNKNNFGLFPNPASEIVTVKKPEQVTDFTITVCNSLGQIILISENQDFINLSGQNQGVYFVLIQTENEIITDKIIKSE